MDFKEKQKTLFKRVNELRSKATPSELIVKSMLEELSLNFIFQKAFISGDFYCIVDFYLPKPYKVCIEVDGGYHLSEIQKRKDWGKDKYLRERRFRVLRITNDEADAMNANHLKALIEKSLTSTPS